MQITRLAIYPIKSTSAISLESALVTHRGFAHDRRWLVTDENGKFITQRQYPVLATIATSIVDGGLLITRPAAENLYVPIPEEGTYASTVTVWKDDCQALDAGDNAAQWFSDFLKMKCRLFYQPERSIRPTDARYSTPKDHTSFADGFPFLLTNETSLDDLNQRLANAVPMSRFRPNIVINGHQPYEEDTWSVIMIGDITFRVAKPCSRCVMTTINPETGEKEGREPLFTLAQYRRTEMGVIFGQNLIPDREGIIRIGDKVTILK
ncbi:MOSC domain-containing protein [Endozoicomonas sp. SCSIO W0465]|uniref:MOSC domain-containing protein n=1 Tax=Endozoicomonas sp. SCSIO W0465 TaxID=2918516 RepID=UPI0020762A95|nr:MOSC domain-containing protein [Endozoicomonas sp. SCSIO W0465]USE39467.1 MOSC domain-containing protein [Endozoicomonas sp. SCSIO W0465]